MMTAAKEALEAELGTASAVKTAFDASVGQARKRGRPPKPSTHKKRRLASDDDGEEADEDLTPDAAEDAGEVPQNSAAAAQIELDASVEEPRKSGRLRKSSKQTKSRFGSDYEDDKAVADWKTQRKWKTRNADAVVHREHSKRLAAAGHGEASRNTATAAKTVDAASRSGEADLDGRQPPNAK